jgi:large-conductance mechanosensitive channel
MNLYLTFFPADFITVIVFIFISIMVFLAIRNIMLWYWKVNDILQNQEKQTILLAEIAELLKT